MDQNTQKEERTEYLSMRVTPTVKKEFEAASTNKDLQETIIRNFLTSEKDWVKEELKAIDEGAIQFRAKLIGLKDAFEAAQDAHILEIEAITDKGIETLGKINKAVEKSKEGIQVTYDLVGALNERIEKLNIFKLERLADTIEKFKSFNEKELEVLRLFLNSEKKDA